MASMRLNVRRLASWVAMAIGGAMMAAAGLFFVWTTYTAIFVEEFNPDATFGLGFWGLILVGAPGYALFHLGEDHSY